MVAFNYAKIKTVTKHSPPDGVAFAGGHLLFEDERFVPLPVDADWFEKYDAKPGHYAVAWSRDESGYALADSALETACRRIIDKAIPKQGVSRLWFFGWGQPVTADVDLLALVDLIGSVIVRVIESCAQNFPPMAGPDGPVEAITLGLRKPGFLARIRFRSMVAQELDKGFFSRYAADVAREAAALAASDEQLTKDVVREVVSPGPLRPNFGF